MICWGGDEWLYQSSASYSTMASGGWGGFQITEGSLYGYGGSYNFQNLSASGLSGGQWAEQQVMEADPGSGGTGISTANGAGFESYLGFYITAQAGEGDTPSDSDTYWPPYGSWWDDDLWSGVADTLANMASAAAYLGMTGMAFDTEQACWTCQTHQFQMVTVSGGGSFTLSNGNWTTGSIPSGASAATVAAALIAAYGKNVVVTGADGGPYSIEFPASDAPQALTAPTQTGVTVIIADHTQADVNRQAYTYGQAVAEQMWTAFPSMVLLWYHYFPPGGWNDIIYEVADSTPYPHAYYAQDAFFQGMLAGMHVVGATGRICLIDASFYRDAAVNVPGANNQAAYFLNSQGPRAWMSSNFSHSVWNYACDHIDIAGFTWRGTDGTGFYDRTQPSDSEWAQSVMDARAYSEGPRRAEYVWNSEWPAAPSVPGGTPTFTYTSSTMLGSGQPSGAVPASSTSPLSTSVPTITNLSTSLFAGVVTITCNAAHAYGIRCVKVYNGTGFDPANPAASYLGAMQMTFEPNGGSYTTNYNSAYQACTFYWSGNNGQWFVLEAISIKDDTQWAVAQAPGSTAGVSPGVANVAVGAEGPRTYH
jgi:hypothetical protein